MLFNKHYLLISKQLCLLQCLLHFEQHLLHFAESSWKGCFQCTGKISALSSFAQGWPPPAAFGWGHWRPEISTSSQKSIQLFIENVVQLLTPFFLLSRNENGLQKRNSVNCLQPQFQKEGAKLFLLYPLHQFFLYLVFVLSIPQLVSFVLPQVTLICLISGLNSEGLHLRWKKGLIYIFMKTTWKAIFGIFRQFIKCVHLLQLWKC